ncbi:MAG: hypothetical protein HUU35_12875, partial [Armatimonadetes bacterium]|nr:hypothetical protein [Armatimonadota bacterium]
MGDATPEFPHGLGQAADLQQLSARLDASEQRFQRAFEHIPDVVVI